MSKILVSEDSIIVNQHISKTLEVAGYEVESAYSGLEATEIAERFRPDLILMDIMMETRDDGIQAALEIKQRFDIPIIFLTALTDDGTLERVKESEPYGYIVKPFNEVELLSNIKVALHKAKAENAIKANRDLLIATFNTIDQAVFLIDGQEKVFYANKSAEKLADRSFEELIGQSLQNGVLIRDEEDHLMSFEELKNLSNRDNDSQVLWLKSKDGDIPVGDFQTTSVLVGEQTFNVFVFKDISDRARARKLEKELEHKRLAYLIEGQENERDRLAREIHDGIGQLINLLKVKIKSLPESPQKDDINPLIEQTLDEVRAISENLHPSRLKDFSLEKNLERLIKQYGNLAKTEFTFSSSDVPDLTFYQKTHLYRITQEALSNVVKHANASEAMVQLIGLNNEVQLTIEDDGQGYDVNALDKEKPHHGVSNIEFRVNSMNGKFTIDSNGQSGTLILVSIPTQNGN